MKFTLRQLFYFIAAAETGSITLASKRASISQPAISTAISHIERELDVQLFLRHHAHGLSLAPLVMPELTQSFLKAYSETRIVCLENHQEGLLQSLRESETEVAITYDLQISDDIGFLPLATLPPYALFAASHPLAHERSVKLSQLAPLPMVLLDLPMSRENFLALFIRGLLKPNIV